MDLDICDGVIVLMLCQVCQKINLQQFGGAQLLSH